VSSLCWWSTLKIELVIEELLLDDVVLPNLDPLTLALLDLILV